MRIVLLVVMLTGCALRPPDDWGVELKDMEGVGNPDIEECQITFGGEVPMVPCTVEVNVEWEI
jgi:hypothetical protein